MHGYGNLWEGLWIHRQQQTAGSLFFNQAAQMEKWEGLFSSHAINTCQLLISNS